MLQPETHPFNNNIGVKSINSNTRGIILGTFPAWEVVNLQNPQMNFYYGSNANPFWVFLIYFFH